MSAFNAGIIPGMLQILEASLCRRAGLDGVGRSSAVKYRFFLASNVVRFVAGATLFTRLSLITLLCGFGHPHIL